MNTKAILLSRSNVQVRQETKLPNLVGFDFVSRPCVTYLYGRFYRQIRRLPSLAIKALFLRLMLFILVRNSAERERFDLSFPLLPIAPISLTMAFVSSLTPSGEAGYP
jgi:hypothetical protein